MIRVTVPSAGTIATRRRSARLSFSSDSWAIRSDRGAPHCRDGAFPPVEFRQYRLPVGCSPETSAGIVDHAGTGRLTAQNAGAGAVRKCGQRGVFRRAIGSDPAPKGPYVSESPAGYLPTGDLHRRQSGQMNASVPAAQHNRYLDGQAISRLVPSCFPRTIRRRFPSFRNQVSPDQSSTPSLSVTTYTFPA